MGHIRSLNTTASLHVITYSATRIFQKHASSIKIEPVYNFNGSLTTPGVLKRSPCNIYFAKIVYFEPF